MPLQNRVTPEGLIIAAAQRGTMMGNRGGCLHDDGRRLGARRWVSRQWICCLLDFNGRRRQVMAPGRYTELFFLDEATALAAGHRPCFECRRRDALRFAGLWPAARYRGERARADDIDAGLHAERIGPGGERQTTKARLGELPDGAFVRLQGAAHLVCGGRLRVWSPGGYGAARPFGQDRVAEVLTPASIIAAMKLGYMPLLHETARDSR